MQDVLAALQRNYRAENVRARFWAGRLKGVSGCLLTVSDERHDRLAVDVGREQPS